MATKLAVFNGALNDLGFGPLVDTGEAIEPGRVLVQNYSRVVNDCLAAGSWNFAMEDIEANADTGVTPNYGSFTEVFAKPSDWVRTIAVSADEDYTFPLLNYNDDVNYWSASVTPIYVRYVSNDTGLGFELTRWPAAFTRYVELALADRCLPRLNVSEQVKERVQNDMKDARVTALNQDAMNENQPKFSPPGSWTMSRFSRSSRDRGRRNSLIG